jgi:hypothetical protein
VLPLPANADTPIWAIQEAGDAYLIDHCVPADERKRMKRLVAEVQREVRLRQRTEADGWVEYCDLHARKEVEQALTAERAKIIAAVKAFAAPG